MFVCMTASDSLTCTSLGIDMDEQTCKDLCEKACIGQKLFVYLCIIKINDK